jgi:hypothetical protein
LPICKTQAIWYLMHTYSINCQFKLEDFSFFDCKWITILLFLISLSLSFWFRYWHLQTIYVFDLTVPSKTKSRSFLASSRDETHLFRFLSLFFMFRGPLFFFGRILIIIPFSLQFITVFRFLIQNRWAKLLMTILLISVSFIILRFLIAIQCFTSSLSTDLQSIIFIIPLFFKFVFTALSMKTDLFSEVTQAQLLGFHFL